MHHTHSLLWLGVGALASVPTLQSCSHSPRDPGPPSPVCAAGPQTGMAGRWRFEGEYMEQVPGDDGVFVAPGLEGVVLELEHAFRDPESCIELYVAGGPELDTASEIGAPTMLTGFFAPPTREAITGGIIGLYYLPGSDISVEIQAYIQPGDFDYSVDAMVLECEFEVYPGDCIIAGNENTPDWDDDGDGEIDEADELELDDMIDPAVFELCHGRIRLVGTRVSGLAALEAPRVHRVGVLSEVGAGDAHPIAASFTLPAARIVLDAGELALEHGVERVRAPARIASNGALRAEVLLKRGYALFSGHLGSDRVLRGGLQIFGIDRSASREFLFEIDLLGTHD